MVLAALSIGLAFAAAPDPTTPRLRGALPALARLGRDAEAVQEWRRIHPGLHDAQGLSLVLELEDPAATHLPDLPYEIQAAGPGVVQIWVPWAEVAHTDALPGVAAVRLPHLAQAKEVVSEGVAPLFNEGSWHDAGTQGQGVGIAVLDVGFIGYESLEGGELPRRVRTHFDTDWEDSAHGTAVAEVLHDVAPKARLHLFSFRTSTEFLQAVQDLRRERVDVVNSSIGFDNVWHADGTSPWTEAVDAAVGGEGLAWVTAAGNENDKYRIAELDDDDGDGLVALGGQTGTWVFAPQGLADVSLRWSEPMDAAETDIDLGLYVVLEDDSWSRCGGSTDPQRGAGDRPYERAIADCGQEWVLAVPEIDPDTTDVAGLRGYLYAPAGLDPDAWTESGGLTLPGDTRRGISVGVCDAELGTAPYYSSRGPTDDGRPKPDLCATGVVSTATLGDGRFQGTSAATPHVAGLAALVADGHKLKGEPGAIEDWLVSQAKDLGDAGQDHVFGWGAAQAGPAPKRCGCATRPFQQAAWLGPLGLLLWIRRTRDLPQTPG